MNGVRFMETTQHCQCRRLARVLKSSAESSDSLPPPGHVCEETCRSSCYNWLNIHWPLSHAIPLRAFASAKTKMRVIEGAQPVYDHYLLSIPRDLEEQEEFKSEFLYIPIAPHVLLKCDEPETWPIPILDSGGEVHLIIRQEVDAGPEKNVVKLLERNHDWCNLLLFLKQHRRHWVRDNQDEVGSAQAYLARHGLPATTDTAHYLLWRLDNDYRSGVERYPSLGLTVTTFCLKASATADEKSQPAMNYDGVITQINASASWVTAGLYNMARTVSIRHKKWWEQSKSSTIFVADQRKLNRGKRERDDYDAAVKAYFAKGLTTKALRELTDQIFDSRKQVKERSDFRERNIHTPTKDSVYRMVRARILRKENKSGI
jgi:hypothetical protein